MPKNALLLGSRSFIVLELKIFAFSPFWENCMETFFIVARSAHIFAGSLAFIARFLAIVSPKGKTLHRRVGIIYVWSMVGVATTATLMSFVKTELLSFFVPLSAFTLQLTLGGWRALERKRLRSETERRQESKQESKQESRQGNTQGRSLTPKLDWTIALGSLGAGVVFLLLGAGALWQGDTMGVVSMVFGGFGVSLAVKNLRVFILADKGVQPKKMEWFFAHLSGMLGAYIATVTAVLVVNADALPPLARWLAPTVVGTLGIAF